MEDGKVVSLVGMAETLLGVSGFLKKSWVYSCYGIFWISDLVLDYASFSLKMHILVPDEDHFETPSLRKHAF